MTIPCGMKLMKKYRAELKGGFRYWWVTGIWRGIAETDLNNSTIFHSVVELACEECKSKDLREDKRRCTFLPNHTHLGNSFIFILIFIWLTIVIRDTVKRAVLELMSFALPPQMQWGVVVWTVLQINIQFVCTLLRRPASRRSQQTLCLRTCSEWATW